MKIINKVFFIVIIMTILIFNTSLYSMAFNNIIEDADEFLKLDTDDDSLTTTIDSAELQGISNTISNILLTIAVGVTLISAVVMGINFAIQSVEDKAQIKEAMIPWIIGIFISFGAFGIWQITMSVFYGLSNI